MGSTIFGAFALLLAQTGAAVPAPNDATPPAHTAPATPDATTAPSPADEERAELRQQVSDLQSQVGALNEAAQNQAQTIELLKQKADALDQGLGEVYVTSEVEANSRQARLDAADTAQPLAQSFEQDLLQGNRPDDDDVAQFEQYLAAGLAEAQSRNSQVEVALFANALSGAQFGRHALEEGDLFRARVGFSTASQFVANARDSAGQRATPVPGQVPPTFEPPPVEGVRSQLTGVPSQLAYPDGLNNFVTPEGLNY